MRRPHAVRRAAPAALLAALALAVTACGEEAKPVEDLTPEEVQAKLLDREFVTGEIITDGANVGVAKGGKLDAEAYLGVDEDPDGKRIYVGIYFFATPEEAAILEKERTEDRDFHAEVVGDMEVEVAGDLQRVIAAIQAPE